MLKRYIRNGILQFHNFAEFYDKRQFSSPSLPRDFLVGRDMLQPMDFNVHEWKRILWYAFDLKKTLKHKSALNILSDKHITLLFIKKSGRNLLSSSLACQMLGAKSTIYSGADFNAQSNFVEIGRTLCQLTDLFMVNGSHQSELSQLAEGSSAPVVGLDTSMFSFITPLAYLMTIQEKYGYLKRLKVAWVGPSNNICNSVLALFPLFGINLQICCICAEGSGPVTPVMMKSALKACSSGSAELHQHSTAGEAIHRSHVVITTGHPIEEYQITIQLMEEAELDWMFLHTLPRTGSEVSDEVFQHENNLSWHASSNNLYIAMALILSTLTEYTPLTSMPEFDGIP